MTSTTKTFRGPMRNVSSNAALRYKDLTSIWPHEAVGLIGVTLPRQHRGAAVVGVYRAAEAGIEDDPAAGLYATVCERHHNCVIHDTRALAFAHSTAPEGWCEDCR